MHCALWGGSKGGGGGGAHREGAGGRGRGSGSGGGGGDGGLGGEGGGWVTSGNHGTDADRESGVGLRGGHETGVTIRTPGWHDRGAGAGVGAGAEGYLRGGEGVDDRLQRQVRRIVREKNGIRVLVELLRYRRQASAADAVRVRAARCLLGLAHDPQIAQMLEKMRITDTLSDVVRSGPVVDSSVECYTHLRDTAREIIARVARRPSDTVGRAGLLDPTVARLERVAVAAHTPITFRREELLGVS
ncbi:unnamed protein product [Discosporangium mesarthrocarpum]